MKAWIALLTAILLVTPAQGKTLPIGTVQGENVRVYSAPDFDSRVLGRVRTGSRVQVMKPVGNKYYRFYPVKVGKRLGYISDTDLSFARPGSRGQSGTKVKRRERTPIYFSRYVGLLVGTTEWKEGISGVNASDQLMIYGLQLSGPDLLFGSLISDLNVALHYGAPAYYGPLSSAPASGFILLIDSLALLPWWQRNDFVGLFGLGPMLQYSSFQVVNGGRAQSLSMLNIGLSTMLGFAFRLGDFGVRLEAKYFIEKQSYKAFQIGLQREW